MGGGQAGEGGNALRGGGGVVGGADRQGVDRRVTWQGE